MRWRELGILLLLAAIWGGSFIFIRVAVTVLGPFALVEIRVGLAGLALLLYALAVRRAPALWQRRWAFLLLGLLNAAIPFCLISTAELHLTASLAAILNATTPLFTALVAAVWLGERLTLRKGVGLGLGLAGVVIAVGWSPLPFTLPVLLSAGASLLAAFTYGLGGVYSARQFKGVPLLDLNIGQCLGAALALLPLAGATAPRAVPSLPVVLAVLALSLLGTAFAYLLFFHLIQTVGATRTLTVTFLVPIFGLIWGAVFLHEAIGAGTLLGLGVILSAILLVSGVALPRLRRVGARATH